MLCSTCPVHSKCKSICPEVERELAKYNRPQIETTKTSAQLEGIELRNAINEFYRSESDTENNKSVETVTPLSHGALHSALSLLTDRQRECLRLFYWEGWSKKRIAVHLGIARPTVIQHIEAAVVSARMHYLTALPADTYTPTHRGEGF